MSICSFHLCRQGSLPGAGVGTFDLHDNHSVTPPQSEQLSTLLGKLEKGETEGGSGTPQPLVSLGSGLPAVPKKLVTKILANEYVDFAELPPAKGKGRPMPQLLEGQVIVVQAADLLQA